MDSTDAKEGTAMTYIPTISPVVSDTSGDAPLAKYARAVITAAALVNAKRSLGHRMASFDISFSRDMDEDLSKARRAAEDAKPPKYTFGQVADDIAQQAFLLLTRDIAEYHSRITR